MLESMKKILDDWLPHFERIFFMTIGFAQWRLSKRLVKIEEEKAKKKKPNKKNRKRK